MIAIADYGLGNLRSVQKAFEFSGYECVISKDIGELESARGLVLPGVGAFGLAMRNLATGGLLKIVRDWVVSGKPFLGICLGLQLLFEYSEEGDGIEEGIGLFKGTVRRFPGDIGMKVPQIGWNSISIKADTPLFKGIENDSHVYFVHSYYVDAADRDDVAATTEYGVMFDSAVARGSIFATQFHPEKSGNVGLRIIKNFGRIVYAESEVRNK